MNSAGHFALRIAKPTCLLPDRRPEVPSESDVILGETTDVASKIHLMSIIVALVYPELSKLGGRMESDAAFFTRRAREERFAATKAEHPQARKAHLQMAARYNDLARAIEGNPEDEESERAGIWF